jgi:YARHG domain
MTRLAFYVLTAGLGVATLAATCPASAGDVQGDAYACSELWVLRNQVYKDNGYCFATARAITYFGNGGCNSYSQSALLLSGSERGLLRDIKASERRQDC